MPYSTNEDLPPEVKERYSDHCQTVFRETWNSAYEQHGEEERAFAIAHSSAAKCEDSAMSERAAIRIVESTDDHDVIEGLGIPFGGPFGGRDSYGTFFSARTDFAWDLFPGEYARPVTYQHGFDAKVGLRRIGGWQAVRTDDDGVWVQAQLDKRQKWYKSIRKLLDADSLGFSAGSAEHSVRIDEKTGEILAWPVYELTLSPTEANPWAVIAVKTGEVAHTLQVRFAEPEEPAEAKPLSDAGTESEVEPSAPEVLPAEPGFPAVRVGKRNSTADQILVQSIHDSAHSLGAMCEGEEMPEAEAEVRSGPVLAIRAGDGPVPLTDVELQQLSELMGIVATERARSLLRT